MLMTEETVIKKLWQVGMIQQQQKENAYYQPENRKYQIVILIKEEIMQQYKCTINKMVIIKKWK